MNNIKKKALKNPLMKIHAAFRIDLKKNNFNIEKYIYFEAIQNGKWSECFRLKKSKLCEFFLKKLWWILRSICSSKIFSIWAQKVWVEKTVHEVETHWLLWKEKEVTGTAVSKEGSSDSLLSTKQTHHCRFTVEMCNSNHASYC